MAKEKLPVSFLTDFISRSWDDVGYLKETIKSIGENFSGTGKVEELLNALLDAYLVCIGQLEMHLEDKDYLDIPEEAKKLEEAIDIHIDNGEVKVSDSSGEEVAIMPIAAEEQEAAKCEGPECEVPPAEVEIAPVEAPVEAPTEADPFAEPFEFEAPEVPVAQPERPFADVGDYFVDFDEPVGEPVSEKELYGEGEDLVIKPKEAEENKEEK